MFAHALSRTPLLLPLQENPWLIWVVGPATCFRALRKGHLGQLMRGSGRAALGNLEDWSGWAQHGNPLDPPLLRGCNSCCVLVSCRQSSEGQGPGWPGWVLRTGPGPFLPWWPLVVAALGPRMSPVCLPRPGKSRPELVCPPGSCPRWRAPPMTAIKRVRSPDAPAQPLPTLAQSLGLGRLHPLQGLGAPTRQLRACLR